MPGLTNAARIVAATAMRGVMLYGQLHTAAAGTFGTSNIATGPRKPITWGQVIGAGDFNLAAPLNFTGGASNGPVHSITLWSAITGGTFYGELFITGDATFTSTGTYSITKLNVLTVANLPFGMNQANKDAIDNIVDAAMADVFGGQPGVLIGVNGPMGAYNQAYGKTASIGGRELTMDDHFRMASITKTFVALAILQQIDAGELTLSTPLSTHVSGIPSGASITVQHLLMMRSGVYDEQQNAVYLLNYALFPSTGGGYTEATSLGIMQSNPSQFTPGTAYQYTNSNYRLLGYILESITGKTAKQVLIDDVITPLGLTETQWPTTGAIPTPAMTTNQFHPIFTGAAGALTTTIGDMMKFGAAIRDGTLLFPATHSLQLSTFSSVPYVLEGPDTYGHGLGMLQLGSWFGHDGSLPAAGTALMFEPYTGTIIAVAENKQTTNLQAFSRIFYRIADYFYDGSVDVGGFFS